MVLINIREPKRWRNQGIFQNSELEYPFYYYMLYWLNLIPPVNPHSTSAYGKGIDRLLK